MWFEKTPSGSYRFRERYTDPLNGLQKTVSVTMKTATRLDQKTALLKLQEKIRKKTARSADVKSLTFGTLVEIYREQRQPYMKPQSFHTLETYTDTLCRCIGSDARVARLTAPIVREKLAHPDPVRYNRRIVNFKTVMRWAYKSDLTGPIDWLMKLEPVPERETKVKRAEKYLEADELELLLDTITNETWHDLSELLVLSGLRVGEALALTVEDVSLKTRTIRVNKTRTVWKDMLSSTKTTAGERTVFIQDELVPVVERILSRSAPDGRLFTATYKAYVACLARASRLCLGRRVGPHIFRHTHVALLAAAGISLDAIARRVGHESSQVTREVYFHVTQRLRLREAEQLREVHLLDEKKEQKRSKRSKKGANHAPFCHILTISGDSEKPEKPRKSAIS